MAIRFTSILRDLIIESSRFQVLADKYLKPKKGERKGMMPFETLFAIIAADPTSKIPEGMDVDNARTEDMEKVKIGKYTQWLLKNFTTPNIEYSSGITDPNSPAAKQAIKEYQELFLEDLYKVTEDLKKFERFKNRLPQEYRDINKLTPEILYNQVKDFSLEKTKASAEEKKEASKTYAHPGAESIKRLTNWTVVKISDQGQLGKDAACFYGGHHLEPSKGETRWCTSSPGLTFFNNYIKDGPLYVIIPNTPKKFTGSMDVGEKSGLPALRYQFHFPSNQYMDPADRSVDVVNFLAENDEDLREYFKPEFMKGLINLKIKDKKIEVNYPNDAGSKFIRLYGFEEFFETLPEDLGRLAIFMRDSKFSFKIPNSIGKLKKLLGLVLEGGVSELPDTVCQLESLRFLSLINTPDLKKLPECIANMPNLQLLNLKGNNKQIVPQSIKQRVENDDDFMLFV
jgi:hypothetical protein